MTTENNELVETEVCSSSKSDRGRADKLVLATLCARLFRVNGTAICIICMCREIRVSCRKFEV